MSKESINKLKNFIYWVLTFLGCMLIGIFKTYAITYTDFTDVHSNTTLYVGYADSGNPISWPFNNSSLYQRNIISMDYVVNTNITGGVHYEFESHMLGQYFLPNSIYSVVDASGTTCLTDTYYLNFLVGEYPRWDFQCPNNSTGFTIHIQQPNSTKLFNDGYMGWGSAILSKTNTPIDTSSSDTQEIIDNANSNANNIINNQNQNTQIIINSNKVCKIYDKISIETDNKFLFRDGTTSDNVNYGITRYISISDTSTITKLTDYSYQYAGICFYNINKTLISCQQLNMSSGSQISIPNNSSYVRFTILKSGNEPQFNICNNGNQTVSDGIDNLTSSLLDDSPVDVSGLGNTVGWLPQGPIDSIINLPLQMDNTLIDSIGGTCVPLHIPLPYVNRYLDVPCISTLMEQMGFKTFWNWVGTIASVIILYRYLLNLYKYYDDLTTLKANFISDFGGAP